MDRSIIGGNPAAEKMRSTGRTRLQRIGHCLERVLLNQTGERFVVDPPERLHDGREAVAPPLEQVLDHRTSQLHPLQWSGPEAAVMVVRQAALGLELHLDLTVLCLDAIPAGPADHSAPLDEGGESVEFGIARAWLDEPRQLALDRRIEHDDVLLSRS